MMEIRAWITSEVHRVAAAHDLRVRGSWLYGEQHLVIFGNKFFSLSDLDVVTRIELDAERADNFRLDLQQHTEQFLISAPVVSIRVEGRYGPALPVQSAELPQQSEPQQIRHNTLFWSYIALLELRDSLSKAQPSRVCDVNCYFENKFLLNIWRNILMDRGELPTSYKSILDRLDGVDHGTRNDLLCMKTGGALSGPSEALIPNFRYYTVDQVKQAFQGNVRQELLDLLSLGERGKELPSILDDLHRVAESKAEIGIVEYSRAKVSRPR